MKLLFIFLFSLFFVTTADTKIVFSSDRDGNRKIYTMNDDGGDLRRVTDNPLRDDRPLWSLDGRKIFFSRLNPQAKVEQVRDLMQMNADGSNIQILLKSDEEFSLAYPAFFTRNGRELAYDFSLRDMESGATRPLRGVEDITGADLSPDGHFIAFAKTSQL